VIAILVHVSLSFLRGRVAVALRRAFAAVNVLIAAGKAKLAVFGTSSDQPTVVLAAILGEEAAAFGADALWANNTFGRLGLRSAAIWTSIDVDDFHDPILETGHAGEHCREPIRFAFAISKGDDADVGPMTVFVTNQRTAGIPLATTL